MKTKTTIILGITLLWTYSIIYAQSTEHHKSFNLAVKDIGFSFGNSDRFTGVRFNFSDYNIKRIDGLNITLGTPGYNAEGKIRGISLGLIRPEANDIRGVTLGGLAIFGGSQLSGINISGLATVCSGDMRWINYGTLILGAGDNLNGINISGLVTMSLGTIHGFSVGGLALVAQKEINGFNLAGIAIGTGGNIGGFTICGLAMHARNIHGVSYSALLTADEAVHGIALSLLRLNASQTFGICGATFLSIDQSNGVCFGGFNKFREAQNGVSIGIVNSAAALHGLQIGVINYAANNPKWAKILPFVNFHY
ncbi:hypothetical protein JW960_08795 [candidate division KSB1 bacterium]|nr:hypothetical protein [candidate division KSB1 bacterium]